MSNEIITREDDRIKRFFSSLDRMLDKIEAALTGCKPTLNGERFLSDPEVSDRLKVSRRTFAGLSHYRENTLYPIRR